MEKLSKGELIFVGILALAALIAIPFLFDFHKIKDILVSIALVAGIIAGFIQLVKQSKPGYVDTRSQTTKKVVGTYNAIMIIPGWIFSIACLIFGIYYLIAGFNPWWLGLVVIGIGILIGIATRNMWKINKESNLS